MYKEYDKCRDKVTTDFYNSSVWKEKIINIKNNCFGLDIYSLFKFNTVEFGEVTHHIIPLKESYEQRLDDDNLILLTEMNHRNIHTLMERGKKKEITNELKEYKKMFQLLISA